MHDLPTHHPFTCKAPPPTPYTEIDTAVNGTQVRCEDVTFGCSRLQNVIKVTPYTHPAHLLSRLHHFVFIS